ncbi:hypothetical protein AVEN_126309-1 [Araneus ventricosus]|uniref:Uncharacterized protein n=1 Tax=Araneus ventricosus TaxID=182803 RepID=A0A4Y2FIL3_ARAVE|nr:hypothetical protein AVEN_126309-1 [Araneus ventricosus]
MRIAKYEEKAWPTHDSASNEFIARKEIVTEEGESFQTFFLEWKGHKSMIYTFSLRKTRILLDLFVMDSLTVATMVYVTSKKGEEEYFFWVLLRREMVTRCLMVT